MNLLLLVLACQNKTTDDTNTGIPLGSSEFSVNPTTLDFGTLFVGQVLTQEVTISNTGESSLNLSAAVSGGPITAYSTTFDNNAPAGGEAAIMSVSLAPSSWGDHGATLTVTDVVGGQSADITITALVVEDNDGDGYGSIGSGGDDCNDQDFTINPGVDEIWYDGEDQNCDGANDYDQDGDSVEVDADCDDTDASAYPGATEIWYNGVDNACDGGNDYDQDLDGYANEVDCVDTDASINPGVVDVWYDGIDSNCDGNSDYDQDHDGSDYPADCNDLDATIGTNQPEVWYDGIDQNCDGANDFDQDADGYDYTIDCVDTDPSAHPGGVDVWYDGVDSDCSGNSDYDQDGDGYDSSTYGGTDCNDLDAAFSPAIPEIWYDGIDQNCDGNDNDQDGDGSIYGVDCNDQDATSYPGATEIWYNGVDNACDGGNDYDQDGDGVIYPTDCYDTDPNNTSSSGGPESWDGVDNDCNGVVDDVPIATLKSGAVYGSTASLQLGQGDALSIGGDMTGDGVDDVAVGSDSVSSGYVYVVSGTTMLTASGAVGNYDSATITGSNTYYMMGLLSGPQQDLDGDGVADLISGGVYNSSYGYIWVYYDVTGSSDIYDSDVYFTSDGQNPDATQSFGAGDVDGDGTLDIVFGGTIDNNGNSTATGNVAVQSGVAYGDYGSSNSDDEIHGTSSYNYLGKEVRVADWNSDGYADFLVGAYGVDTGATDAGAVYLFEGNSNLSWNSDADSASILKISGTTASNAIGQDPLANPGDLNGDGSLDLVISAEGLGSVWLWWGGNLSGTTTVASANATFTGATGDFGSALVYDTDFDGDGGLDLLIGSDDDDTSATNAGAVWFFGNANWSGAYTSADSNGVFLGESGDQLGTGLASGGDVNGDGRGDLLVGAAYDDTAATDGGVVYLVLGR